MHIAQTFENMGNLNSASSTGNLFLNLRDFPSFNIIFDKLHISFNIFLNHDNPFLPEIRIPLQTGIFFRGNWHHREIGFI